MTAVPRPRLSTNGLASPVGSHLPSALYRRRGVLATHDPAASVQLGDTKGGYECARAREAADQDQRCRLRGYTRLARLPLPPERVCFVSALIANLPLLLQQREQLAREVVVERGHMPHERARLLAREAVTCSCAARPPPRGACAAPSKPVRKAFRTFCWTTVVCCDRTVAFKRRCAVARAVIRSRLTCRAPRAAPFSALRAPRCAAASAAR